MPSFSVNPFGGKTFARPSKPLFNASNRSSKFGFRPTIFASPLIPDKPGGTVSSGGPEPFNIGLDKPEGTGGFISQETGEIVTGFSSEAIQEIQAEIGTVGPTFTEIPGETEAQKKLRKAQELKLKGVGRKAIDRSGFGVGSQGIFSILTGSLTGVKSSKTGV